MTTAAPPDETRDRAGRAGAPQPLPAFVLPPSQLAASHPGGRRRAHGAGRVHRVAGPVATGLAVLLVLGVAAFAVAGDRASQIPKGDASLAQPAVPPPVSLDVATRPSLTTPTPTAPGSETVLLVHGAPDGSAGSITLLVAGRRGTHIVLIPPGAMTEVPSFGLEAVGRASALGGPPLLQATVENLFGVALDRVVVVGDAELVGLVQPAGDLTVDIPLPVDETGPKGEVHVVWDGGPTVVAPDEVPRLLAVRGDANDLARLARHQVFWEAWIARLRRRPGAVPTGAAADVLAPVLRAFAASRPSIALLPVEAVDAGAGQDMWRVRTDEVDALARSVLRDAVPVTKAGRPRVQILNGAGRVGVAQEVTLRLVQPSLRARVLYTGNADGFDHRVTDVVIYDETFRAVGEQIRRALGAGRVVLSRRPLGIVDVTVVVGKDFR